VENEIQIMGSSGAAVDLYIWIGEFIDTINLIIPVATLVHVSCAFPSCNYSASVLFYAVKEGDASG
jgi:hypothetical protein